MNFEGSVPALLTLAFLPIAVPVFFALLGRLLHIRLGCLPLLMLIGIGLLSVFGIAAYLDSGGIMLPGEVLAKKESLVYHLDGSWNRKMVAEVRFNAADTSQPTTESLNLLPGRFDELQQGDFVQLRSYDLPGMLRITRLEDQHTMRQFWYWLTDQPFLFYFVLGLLLVVAVRVVLHAHLTVLFFLCGLVTIGSWWMSNVAVPVWEQSTTLLGSLNSVSATVREIHPPYLGTGLQGWLSTHLFAPYELILLDTMPLGRSQTVLSIDAVDRGSVKLRPGQIINLEYSAANPRSAIVPDGTRSYLWKNALLNTLFALIALAAIGRFAFLIREQRQNPNSAANRRNRRRNREA